MPAERTSAVLAAEADPHDAQNLLRCLTALGWRALLATSARQALDIARREIFSAAVAAAELALADEPLLARLSRLPALEMLVATGPPGEPAMEARARRAGADVYLTRPVSAEALAKALQMVLPARETACGW